MEVHSAGREAVVADRKKPGKGGRARPGTEQGESRGEPILIGVESWRDLPTGRLIWEQEKQRHRMQRRAVVGLTLLLALVLSLGVLAMLGVGLGWYAGPFAVQVLAITITPSFTGWLLVVRWAFRPDGRARGGRRNAASG